MQSTVCNICNKVIRRNQKSICCGNCHHLLHIKCNELQDIDLQLLNSSSNPFFCINCISSSLPFCSSETSISSTRTIFKTPLHLSDLFNHLNNFTDANIAFSPNLPNCSYQDPEYFNTLEKKFKKSCFSIFHQNISSISKHFDDFHELMTSMSINFDVIGITESRIRENMPCPINISLPNYSIEQTPTRGNAGGALLYIHKKHSYKLRCDLTMYKEKELESTFIEIILPKRTNVIIGCTYRHPSMNTEEFNTFYLSPLLLKLSKEKKKFYS